MVPEPPGVPVIEEITIDDSSDDDEVLPSNNVAINKENTPEKRTEKAIDPLSNIIENRLLSTEYYNCNTFREDCNSTLFDDETQIVDPLANIKVSEPYSLDDRLNGDFIILDQERQCGSDDSDDSDSIIYMDTEYDEDDYNSPAPSNVNNRVDHTTPAPSNISDEDSDKELCIDEDAEPPDDNTIHDTNATDKLVSNEKAKSLSNENVTAEKKKVTVESSVNDKKKTDDSEIDVEKDSDGSQKNLVLAPKDAKNNKMRVCLKQLLKPYCCKCKGPGKTYGWLRRQKVNCLRCGTEILYQCVTCNFLDQSIMKAMWHVKRCCSDMLWRCYKCSYASVTKERVKAHITINHKNKENNSCDQYSKDGTGNYRCPICRRAFKLQTYLNQHEKFCGIERYVRIVGQDRVEKKKKYKKKPKKNKEPKPSVAEEDKKNADDYINLHCCKCKLTFEKGKKEKKCDKCETALLWQCIKCGTNSKSYCGLYDHVNNCTNEITQLILI